MEIVTMGKVVVQVRVENLQDIYESNKGQRAPDQIRALDIEDNARLLQLFRLNRDTGLIPLIFLCVALLL